MPKYLVKASYTAEGTKALIEEGGTMRVAAVEAMIKGLGGTLDGFYYALGETDAYVLVDLPDETTAIAVSLAVNASGAVTLSTVPLMTPEEMDAACRKTVDYRAPGK